MKKEIFENNGNTSSGRPTSTGNKIRGKIVSFLDEIHLLANTI